MRLEHDDRSPSKQKPGEKRLRVRSASSLLRRRRARKGRLSIRPLCLYLAVVDPPKTLYGSLPFVLPLRFSITFEVPTFFSLKRNSYRSLIIFYQRKFSTSNNTGLDFVQREAESKDAKADPPDRSPFLSGKIHSRFGPASAVSFPLFRQKHKTFGNLEKPT